MTSIRKGEEDDIGSSLVVAHCRLEMMKTQTAGLTGEATLVHTYGPKATVQMIWAIACSSTSEQTFHNLLHYQPIDSCFWGKRGF
jgi:hypothetical protein